MENRQKELEAMMAPGINVGRMDLGEILDDMGKRAAGHKLKDGQFVALLMHGKKANLTFLKCKPGSFVTLGGKHFKFLKSLTSKIHKHPNGKLVVLHVYDEAPPEVRFPDTGVKL